ncbi:MAG: TauD/TfdA family dioxygenase [Methyloprofundus sp.]|nr:TauD/TfdA family dioxygenase [Methyloprofundus sp.]
MAIVTLSNDFQASLMAGLKDLHEIQQFKHYIKKNKAFVQLVDSLKKILSEDQHVVIRGLANNSEVFFEAFIGEFGVFYGAIERTGIKIDCKYTGCNRKALGLHNDDAVDIYNQPKFGFIQVTKPDPLKSVSNGVVVIDDLVKKLKFENPKLLDDLLAIPVPMLSYGINYISDQRDEIITGEPILYKKDGMYQVRFDDNRIAHYYYKKKLKQSHEELCMIENFIKIAHNIKHIYHLECGDILIHNNLTTLHDRSECSLLINEDGHFDSREIMVSFAR